MFPSWATSMTTTAIPVNFKPRYRLESVNGKSKMIDLKTGEDISQYVMSVTINADSEGVWAAVHMGPSMVDVSIEIPQDYELIPFSP